MKIAIHGLGRMGSQIAQKLSENGQMNVIAHNRSKEPIDEAVRHGAIAAYTKEDVIREFEGQRIVLWLMLPSDIVDEQLSEWTQILPKGSLIIDGGNSDFRKTQQRNQTLKDQGQNFIDIGVSGGVWGYKNGFSMMCGTDNREDYELLKNVLVTLASPDGDFELYGPSGSGHFVKMVHNAIEYGMMESLAEGYRLIKEGPIKDIDLVKVSRVWQHRSVITSWLNELTGKALSENTNLDGINGDVAQSGEALWSLEVAKELGIPMPAINEALNVRIESQKGNINFATKLLSAMRNKFGGHKLNNES